MEQNKRGAAGPPGLRHDQAAALATHGLPQAVLDAMPDLLYVFDTNGRCLLANQRVQLLCGPAQADLPGRTLADMGCQADVADRLGEGMAQVIGSGQAHKCLTVSTQDAGSELRIEHLLSPVFDAAGQVVAVAGCGRDLTERLRAQERLRADAERSRAIQHTAVDGFMLLDAVRDGDGRITDFRWRDANPAAERIVGKPATWFPGRLLLQEMPGNRDAGLFDAYVQVVETGAPWSQETTYQLDGVDVYLRITASKVGDGFAVNFADLSAARAAEQRVRASEDRLRIALQATNAGAYDWNMQTDVVHWTPGHFTLLGLPPDAQAASDALWRRHVHPEDLPRVERTLQQAIDTGERFEAAYRVVRADGALRHMQNMGLVVRGEGQPPRLVGAMTDVTDQVLASQALAASEQQFRTVVDLSPVGLALLEPALDDAGEIVDFRWTFLNRAGAQAIGQPVDRLVGQRLGSVLPDVWAPPGLLSGFVAALRSGRAQTIEVTHGQAAAQRSFLNIAAPHRDGLLVWFLDITRQKQAEQAALAGAESFAALADSVPALVWESDTQGACTYVNQPWSAFTGRARDSLLQQGWLDAVHPEDRNSARQRWHDAVAQGTGYEAEYRLLDAQGRARWFMCRAVAVPTPDGLGRRWFGTCTDIDAAKATERRLREQDAALREADRRKDEFLAILAHELRNPLAPVRSAVAALRRVFDDVARRELALNIAEHQIATMARLLDDLLDVSRITSGKLQLQSEVLLLRRAVDAAVETALPVLNGRQHRLVQHWHAPTATVLGDPVRLAQIFTNLLTNAAKYMDAGGLVQVDVGTEGDQAVVRVRDQGIGLAAQSLGGLFTMFSQVHSALNRAEGGLGIGLALVKGLTELHGGTVQAHSDGLGRGSEFTVRLPLHAQPAVHSAPDPAGARGTRRRRILVVDDNRDGAQVLSMLLELLGHAVVQAHDGPAGLAAADAFEPELAFIDIGMPGMDGHQVARQMQTRPWRSRAILVALTGWGSREDRQRALDAGFDAHLTKPASEDELQRLLQEAGD